MSIWLIIGVAGAVLVTICLLNIGQVHRKDFSILSCRVGIRSHERGVAGLRLVRPQDGDVARRVVRREIVRVSQPEAGQEFFYFETKLPRRTRWTYDCAILIVQYQIEPHVGGSSSDPDDLQIQLDFRSATKAFESLRARAVAGQGWRAAAFRLSGSGFGSSRGLHYEVHAMEADFRVSAQAADRIVSMAVREVTMVGCE